MHPIRLLLRNIKNLRVLYRAAPWRTKYPGECLRSSDGASLFRLTDEAIQGEALLAHEGDQVPEVVDRAVAQNKAAHFLVVH
jgi:hypothetical protein